MSSNGSMMKHTELQTNNVPYSQNYSLTLTLLNFFLMDLPGFEVGTVHSKFNGFLNQSANTELPTL
jgi:hypothetical protein